MWSCLSTVRLYQLICLYSTDREMWVEMYVGGCFRIVHDFVNIMLGKQVSPIKVSHIARLVVLTA
jgi:hypothetical protein